MRIIWFCALILFPVLGTAEDEVKVSCRFLSLESTPPSALVNVAASGAEVACKITTGSISAETSCVMKGGVVSFITASDRKPAASATIPANVKSAILIFVAGPKNATALPWRVFVIEDSIKNFPDGGAFVANFHSQDIRFVIGESKIMLHPGGSNGVPRPEKRDDFNMAPVAFQFQQGETWRDASETLLRFLPGLRYLIFASLDGTGRPKVTTFQDTKTNVPAKPAP